MTPRLFALCVAAVVVCLVSGCAHTLSVRLADDNSTQIGGSELPIPGWGDVKVSCPDGSAIGQISITSTASGMTGTYRCTVPRP